MVSIKVVIHDHKLPRKFGKQITEQGETYNLYYEIYYCIIGTWKIVFTINIMVVSILLASILILIHHV